MDFFGKDAGELRGKKLYLLDMDGTIYNENKIFDGTLKFLDAIKNNGGRYVFITNNSSKGLADYVKKVRAMGIDADEETFFTSTQAASRIIKKDFLGKKIYCQGTQSMISELRADGIDVTEEIEDDIAMVLVGFDLELTSEKLRKTCFLLGRDIPFFATNCDLRCPVDFGYVPDCGSICCMLTNCTGKKPKYIGKPEPLMVECAMEKFGYSKDETVIVGDRLYTDIATGVNAGVTSICVLSGEATLDDIKESFVQPTFVFKSVKEISADIC